MVPCIFISGRRSLFICLSWLTVLVGFTFSARDLTTLLPTDMRRWASVFDFPTVAAAYFPFGAMQLLSRSTRQAKDSLLPVEKNNWMALLFETAFFSDMWRASSSFSSSVYIPLILLVLCVLAWFQVQIILYIPSLNPPSPRSVLPFPRLQG